MLFRSDRYETVDGLVAAFKSAWNEAGVPMQGTLITIAKPVEPSPADKTRMKPTAEPTKRAAKAGAAEPVALAEKKRSPFVWVGVIAVVAICLGSLFVARQNRLFTTFLNRRATATPTFTAPATVTKQAAPPVQTPLRSITPNQPLNLPPEALVAQQRVKDNPNDLQARLDLAVALWSAEMPGASYDTLAELIKLAGANNEAFYIQAGDKFVAIEGWLPAAALYFQARKTYGLGGNVPNNILDGFHQSYYRGAERAEAPSVLPFDKVAQVDQPIALVAQARNAFYSGHIDDAATFLNQVKRLSPNMPEAFLLEAEMNSVTGENEKARLIANGLLADLSAPDWVRAFAEEIIKKLP